MTLKNVVIHFLPKKKFFYLQLFKNRVCFNRLLKQTQAHYYDVEQKLKLRSNSKLRFCSYVVFDSCFAAGGLMELMLEHTDQYDAKIVVIPDVSRGQDHMLKQYKLTKDYFLSKYGSEVVLDGYDEKTQKFLDYSNEFDIIYLSNPYDIMVNSIHGIKYLSKKNVLPVYMSYGCMPDNYGCKIIMPILELSLFWKVFADNKISYLDYKKYELFRGKNVVLSGYAKMDALAKCTNRERCRKKVIIAPHHTVNNPQFPLSNFLQYYDFILELPKKFPEIDFVFRPHPLLFTNLINGKIWTKSDVDDYISKLNSLGIEYSYNGDYLDLFLNSDAIIHDCSSFIVEYLYTGKPCCYVAKRNYKKIFSALGKLCLENYYLAFSKDQIEDFITNVVIKAKDPLKEKREKYAIEELAINYPNVSLRILEEIRGC